MCPLPEPPRDYAGRFDATHWSVVLAAAKESRDPASALAALTELCQTYWAPLYGLIRGRGVPLHDAEDLTQGFFAHFIESRLYARADQQKGPFRALLLASLRNFLADAHDREQALKRGGEYRFLSLDEQQAATAENLFQTSHGSAFASTEDQQFERQWAQALINAALDRLAQEYRLDGKGALFGELEVFVKGGGQLPPSYETLAARLSMPPVTVRSHVARLRVRYREVLRSEVRRTVGSPEAVDGELRELLRVLTTH